MTPEERRAREEDPAFAETLAGVRVKARAERGELDADKKLAAIRDRFMGRGPRQYRVLDDNWWNR